MGEERSESRFGEFVLVRRHGYVAELVLDRPKAMNAVSTAMAGSIAEACAALVADRDVRVTVLTSSHERAFCVGADLKERNSLTDAELVRQRPLARGAYTGVLELPMPTIAAVHGFALGGGFELALSCDLIVADGTAVVGLPEEPGQDREEALGLGARIAANSPVGLRAAKRALRLGHGLDLRAGLEVEDAAWRSVAFSGDRAEGVAAFNEKRAPVWPGE
jgi:enoyl-CoA hydratase/carnithine racemase